MIIMLNSNVNNFSSSLNSHYHHTIAAKANKNSLYYKNQTQTTKIFAPPILISLSVKWTFPINIEQNKTKQNENSLIITIE